ILLRPAVRAFAVAIGLAAVTLGLALARGRSPAWARASAAAVATLAVADLLVAHRGLQPVAPRELYTHRPAVVAALQSMPHERVYAYDYTRGEALARLRRPPDRLPLQRVPDGWTLEAS